MTLATIRKWKSSPRAWGCFSRHAPWVIRGTVFPTCVGVFLPRPPEHLPFFRLPHVRGGVSFYSFPILPKRLSSPRAWGCFRRLSTYVDRTVVFPTCVGVFLGASGTVPSGYGLPHVRGGVSIFISPPYRSQGSSPRAWGCFHFHFSSLSVTRVFPTCVGVFPVRLARLLQHERLPHVRGGFPRGAQGTFLQKVFPTCVGVFLLRLCRQNESYCLPHVRGGVSKGIKNDYYQKSSSLRAWECFRTSGALRGPLKGENHVYDH